MKPKVLRDKILNMSHDSFLKQGYGCVSVDDIATDLKISKKTIYNYFPSKKVILMHVIENMQHIQMMYTVYRILYIAENLSATVSVIVN